jgi:hypothetical protein
MGTYPSVDESRDRLHRAGWSVGEIATAAGWLVTDTNGENALDARGKTLAEAWWRACEQARAVGMLAPARSAGIIAVAPRRRRLVSVAFPRQSRTAPFRPGSAGTDMPGRV